MKELCDNIDPQDLGAGIRAINGFFESRLVLLNNVHVCSPVQDWT